MCRFNVTLSSNEEVVGEQIKKSRIPRKEIYVVTKVSFHTNCLPDPYLNVCDTAGMEQ